ncbi:hypothetical protein DCC81_24800 [Chitinophaga parva]|uniref:Uncharacterized protein n=1 Tax=Chitinophaga parva TaxID=2169414 RepID=A0A2T7BBP9_9BACT|nr:hypothetical protein [Chitinophaga parva]PUZ21810.1 hypothetical protein DCC81_24800 [Chitinophaga parva]
MANYQIQYISQFQDTGMPAKNWRVELLLKNGQFNDAPYQLVAGATPLKISSKNDQEDKFSPIASSTATFVYKYIDDGRCPAPEIFTDVENDTWLMNVYVDGVIFWQGMVKPDNNNWPWNAPSAYDVNIGATDYISQMKTTMIDLNKDGKFFYGQISNAEFIARTIFHVIPYGTVKVRVQTTAIPGAIGAGNFLSDVYHHDDAWYDFTEGPLFVYDCLTTWLKDNRMRLLYSDGAFWIQSIPDLYNPPATCLDISSDTLAVYVVPYDHMLPVLPGEILYCENSADMSLNAPIKQQNSVYKYKAINQLVNFNWADFDGTVYPGWTEAGPLGSLVLSKVGDGTAESPYRNHMEQNGSPSPGGGEIRQNLPAGPITSGGGIYSAGWRLQFTLKAYAYYTKGVVISVGIGSDDSGSARYLQSDGTWLQLGDIPPGQESMIQMTFTPSSQPGFVTADITSLPLPPSNSKYWVAVHISGPLPADADPLNPIPPGTAYFNEIYPISISVLRTMNIQTDVKAVNRANYTNKPDDLDLFFLDLQDGYLSNTVFYKDAGSFLPLPKDNWTDSRAGSAFSLQRGLHNSLIGEYAKPTYKVDGTFLSSTLRFHQVVILADKGNRPAAILHDDYDVKQRKHSVTLSELIGTYPEIDYTEVAKPKDSNS